MNISSSQDFYWLFQVYFWKIFDKFKPGQVISKSPAFHMIHKCISQLSRSWEKVELLASLPSYDMRGPRGISITSPSIIAPRFDFSGAWKSIGHFSRDFRLSAGFRSVPSCSAYLAEPVTSFAGDIVAQAAKFLIYRVTLVTGSFQGLRCRHSVNTRTREGSCISVCAATSFTLFPLQRTDSQAQIYPSISLQLTDYSLNRCPEQQVKLSAQFGLSK